MWPEFELIQAVLVVFDICKYKKDSIKNEGARVVTTFLSVSVYGDFFRRSRAANSAVRGRIWPKFELHQAFMVVFLTYNNEEDPIKNESTRVVTTLYIDLSDAQGQITPELVVRSGRNLNSSKLSCIFMLDARIDMIQSKLKRPKYFSLLLNNYMEGSRIT